jgi:hypothetical protein
VFHPILNSAKEVKTVTIERVGSKRKGLPLSTRQRTSLKEIVGELSAIGSVSSGGATAYDVKGWLGAIGTGIACGLAAVEGGANILADADCIVATGAWLGDDDDDDDDDDN